MKKQTSQPHAPMLNLKQSHTKIRPMKKSKKVRGLHRIENLIAKSSPNAFAVEYDWGKARGKEVL
jgi:hypothetical protein